MDLLFSNGDLAHVLRATEAALLKDVQDWDSDQLLSQSESEIAAHLADKHSAHCPVLDREGMYATDPEDARVLMRGMLDRRIEVPVTRLTVHIPYEGEKVLFELRPSTFSLNPPRAKITKDQVILAFEERELDGERLQAQVQATLRDIETGLERVRAMTEAHNGSLPGTTLAAIRQRKEKIIADRNTVAGLGIPIKRPGDAPGVSVPVHRKKPSVAPVPTRVSAPFEPEPMLSDRDYEDALRVLVSAGQQLERSPSVTLELSEESRRDIMLVSLNAQFEGQAGGELFNGAGKTDILLRVDDRNVFIGECKIWRGPRSFTQAIDQLLSYLVWRDTKAALLLFVENKDASAVIDKANDALTHHPRCVRAIPSEEPEVRSDFVFRADGDDSREIRVALLPLVIVAPGQDDP